MRAGCDGYRCVCCTSDLRPNFGIVFRAPGLAKRQPHGPAVHYWVLNPPWGGHGFNTGIGDAVNIGWKLVAVLDGWGGDSLLASYEAERRPVAERTIREATANMSVLAPELGSRELEAPGLTGEQAQYAAAQVIQASKDREFHSLGIVLGYQYDASLLLVRPDQHVAWRGASLDRLTAGTVIDRMRGFCREPLFE